MAAPIVPARPTRATAGPTAVRDSMPTVPPRPARKVDPSPAREELTRSPLNELPATVAKPGSRRSSRTSTPADGVIKRPPSVSLPSVGQEGSEYASLEQLPAESGADASEDAVAAPQQTRVVSDSVQLHAPKASVPTSTAEIRIAAFTRTDSAQAAAAGIGRAKPEDDVHREPSSGLHTLTKTESHQYTLRSPRQFRSPSSAPSIDSRPGSIHEVGHEHGIPEIGRQIPLYPNAGDVQAPAPASPQPQHAAGIGFFNDGSARAHQRRRSARPESGPPGSYGLHGHGMEPQDNFERAWAAKHPKESAMEGYGVYGHFRGPRPATALSSEALNKLVDHTSDAGLGTNPTAIGTPNWEVANQATEEYISRYSTPTSTAAGLPGRRKRLSSGSQPAVESSLRHSFHTSVRDDVAVKDDGTIHLEPLERKLSNVARSTGTPASPHHRPASVHVAEGDDSYDDHRSETPILAPDEAMKRPASAYLHPAISPELKPEDHFDSGDHDTRRGSFPWLNKVSSRPNSVHGGYHGGNLHRFISHEDHHVSGAHTPLEEIEEYEPLFPEDEPIAADKKKPVAKESHIRPGLEHHHFPSQDIWEDTPSSLQYQTIVETPDLPPEEKAVNDGGPLSTDEPSAKHEAEQGEQEPHEATNDANYAAKPKQLDRIARPRTQRFPSQDIWEDSPESMYLVTTISNTDLDAQKGMQQGQSVTVTQDEPTTVAQPERPPIPARPQRKSKLAEEVKPESDESASTKTTVVDSNNAVASPPDESALPRTAPAMPERQKPVVPARPAARSGAAPTENMVTSPAAKPKPPVTARLGGEKIAALKSGFMNDLNQRLKLGPVAPPKPAEPATETEEPSKAPLSDARKERTKGPPRRKPATTTSTASATGDTHVPTAALAFSAASTLWHIDDSTGELHVVGFESGEDAKVTLADDSAPVNALESEKAISTNETVDTAEHAPAQAPVSEDAKCEAPSDTALPVVDQMDASQTADVNNMGDRDESAVDDSKARAEELKEKVLQSQEQRAEAESKTIDATAGKENEQEPDVAAKESEW